MRWTYKQLPPNPEIKMLMSRLATKELFPESLANILVQRGIDSFEKTKDFLKPNQSGLHDPWLLKDMDKACERILQAISKSEKVLIYGDYDVDGTTSVSLMTLFFRDWGVDFEYYIPDRYSEGYGISFQGIDYAISEGIGLVIALDCGTKAVDKVRYAKVKGLDFIVVDHHTPGEEFPDTVAMINPRQKGCTYPFKDLSACGLAFKLISALEDRFRAENKVSAGDLDALPLERYADLITLSIACDIVPLKGENRIISWFGIEKVRNKPLPGIAALMQLSDGNRSWDISDLVFFVGPRINSAGRLKSGREAVRLLLGDSDDLDIFAADLHQYNADRQALDKAITADGLDMIANDPTFQKRKTTVLYNKKWHKGVIGIVASRLIERHFRPTILLTASGENWVGSGRSVPGFNLYEALEACKSLIVQFGGHKYAAGLTVSNEDIQAFSERFENVVAEKITKDQQEPELKIAYQTSFSEITPRLIRLMKRFSPFGPGNPEPVFEAKNVTVKDLRILKEEHVRFSFQQEGILFEGIGFGLAHRWNEINQLQLDIAFQPDFKTWRGKTSIQLKLKDFRPAKA